MTSRRLRLIWWIVLASIAIALYAVTVPIHAALYQTPVPLAFAFSALVCGAIPLVPATPRTAIALFSIGLLGLAASAGTDRDPFWPWPLSVPSIIALAFVVGLVAFFSGWRRGLIAWLLALAAALVANVAQFPQLSMHADATMADLIVAFSIAAAAYPIALLVAGRERIRSELAHEREVSAEEQARRQLVEERARIAREMHDVVAHGMSIIQVQASTARFRLPDLGDEASAEFDDIAASARTALTEMRRLLGTLRTDDQEAERMPQQTLAQLPALIEATRRAGVDIDSDIDGGATADTVPESVQVAAFRIAQEAVSNAVRHAPGSRIQVRLRVNDAAELWLDIVNSAPARMPAPTSGGGHGIVGMRERTAMLSGTLETTQTPDGGWLVHAVLPCDTVTAELRDPQEHA